MIFNFDSIESIITLGILLLCVMVGGVVFFVLLCQKKFTEQQLTIQQMLLVAALDSQERERKRIAEELHDGVGATLVAAKLLASRLPDCHPSEELQELKHILAQTIYELRTISRGLSPLSVQRIGLVKALDSYCTLLNKAAPVRVIFTHEEMGISSTFRAELSLYRVAQELIHNALKQANPTYVQIFLSVRQATLYLEVEHDGKSFDLITTNPQGVGLLDIRSHLKILQGDIHQKA